MLKYDIEKHRQDVRAADPSEAWEEKDTIELRTLHQPTPSVFFLFLRFLEGAKGRSWTFHAYSARKLALDKYSCFDSVGSLLTRLLSEARGERNVPLGSQRWRACTIRACTQFHIIPIRINRPLNKHNCR